MNASLVLPSANTSPIARKTSYGLLQDDNSLGNYSPYDMKSEPWTTLTGLAPAGVDYGVPQGVRGNFNQAFKQAYGNTQSAYQNPTYNFGVDHDTLPLAKESLDPGAQPRDGGFGKGNIQKNFVRKLFEMLEDPLAQAYIRWLSDGNSFVVENQEEFSKNVLGRYLKTENFQSFIRQLNMYDFHKTNKAQRAQRGVQGPQQFVFSHPKFTKGRPDLLAEIKRKGVEPQDQPPQYNEISTLGPSIVPGHLPLSFPQSDHQAMILLQAENQRLATEVARLREANAALAHDNSVLKETLRVNMLPQAQNESSTSSVSNYGSFYDTNTSHHNIDLPHNGNLFDFNYSEPTSEQAGGAPVFSHLTGNSMHNTSNQAQSIGSAPNFPLDSTTISRHSSSNIQSPNIGTIPPSSPQLSRGRSKRPASWYDALNPLQHLNLPQWLNSHASENNCEAGPSNVTKAIHQNSYGTTHPKLSQGGRSLTVMRVQDQHASYTAS